MSGASTERRQGNRLGFLDAVRGVAALVVAVGHGSERLFPGYLERSNRWFSLGRLGVCAFFLVSGYVIPITLERGGGLRAFAISRACRLYPLYWASLAAILLVSVATPEALPVDFRDRMAGAAFVNVTMFQEFAGVPHAIGLYYTLTIELVWYIACAALFALGWLHRTELIGWIAIAGLAVAGVGVPMFADRHVPFSTGFYLVTMLVGTAFARWHAGVLDARKVTMLAVATLAVGAVGAWANYVHLGGTEPEGALGWSSAVLPWVVAYTGFAVAQSMRTRTFPLALTWLGLVSYSVYLVHPVLLPLVGGPDRPFVRLVVLLVASVAIAAVTQRWIEAPAQAFSRTWRKRAAGEPATVAGP